MEPNNAKTTNGTSGVGGEPTFQRRTDFQKLDKRTCKLS